MTNSRAQHPTLEQRRALCEARVTLNGADARISGSRHEFATVRDTRTGLGCEWSWETVARIVASHSNFTS